MLIFSSSVESSNTYFNSFFGTASVVLGNSKLLRIFLSWIQTTHILWGLYSNADSPVKPQNYYYRSVMLNLSQESFSTSPPNSTVQKNYIVCPRSLEQHTQAFSDRTPYWQHIICTFKKLSQITIEQLFGQVQTKKKTT